MNLKEMASLPIRDRKVMEFVRNGSLGEFESVVASLIARIEAENCEISARYDQERSSFVPNAKGGRIRICLKPIYSDPIHIIWTMLHEFGHCFLFNNSLEHSKYKKVIEREERAWNIAEEMLFEYSELIHYINNFNFYRESCLDTYRKQLNDL